MSVFGSTVGTARARNRAASPATRQRVMIGEALSRPLADYYLLVVCTALLVVFGMVMVLSSSSVYAMINTGNSYYYEIRQLGFLVVGLPVAIVLSRCGEIAVRVPLLRRMVGNQGAGVATERILKVVGWVMMLICLVLLGLVVFSPLGVNVWGNKAWLQLGPVQIQPSEFTKVAFVLWSAAVFASRQRSLDRPIRMLVPYLPVALLMLGLVAAEQDIGTLVVMAVMVMLQLWFVGAPGRILAAMAGLGGVGMVAFLALESLGFHKYMHVCRIASWSNNLLGTHLPLSNCTVSDQPLNALYGFATGGWWGVGLGASRQKWGGLYNGAQTDYVLAVIGEELGLVGTLMVIGLFVVLGYAGLRVARASDTLFRRVVAAGLTGWLMVQAAVNVLVALELMPVAGVGLPFVSYGGSGLLSGLIAIGVLMALARQEPTAVAALGHRGGTPPRLTGVVASSRR
ncbi:MAG: putative lipid II flippase FtsW [Propionibacteriaceae bacterium]|nr:putative lipid II flippase FtsW [Propionibacteriaceae bacterium]